MTSTRQPPQPQYWVVIPAAGIGRRFGLETPPKQYATLGHKTVIEYSIACFLQRTDIGRIVVALAPGDSWWSALELSRHEKIITVCGGSERFHSVWAALQVLSGFAGADDWVLIHDAVRPCLRQSDVDALISQTLNHPDGGVLACPIQDTLKRADVNGRVGMTVERDGIWRALTPQMFLFKTLYAALEAVIYQEGSMVSDEAMVIEQQGGMPVLVRGRPDNIKITQQEDILLASCILQFFQQHSLEQHSFQQH